MPTQSSAMGEKTITAQAKSSEPEYRASIRRWPSMSARVPAVCRRMVFGPARQFCASMAHGPLTEPSAKVLTLIGSALNHPAKKRVPQSIPMAMKKKDRPSR